MSATSTDATAADFHNNTAPQALIRIAIPSFKIGWGKPKARKPKYSGPTREEFQNLFGDDLHRSMETKVALTPEERRDYDQAVDLRDALYGKSH